MNDLAGFFFSLLCQTYATSVLQVDDILDNFPGTLVRLLVEV